MKYAHSKRDPTTGNLLPKEHWHTLEAHLEDTAEKAALHAASFQCEILGEILGTLHDYGKNSREFGRRLEDPKYKADHKTAGTLAAYSYYPFPYGIILAYAIYGHHGGLPDHISRGGRPGLDDVLSKNKYAIIDGIPPNSAQLSPEAIPARARSITEGMSRSLWIRMLYSALVDADFLDTERFMQPEKTASRQTFLPLQQLRALYQTKVDQLLALPSNSVVARARRKVLESCIRAAAGPKGFYTLTAPTGTGKTYASLAFAMNHFRYHPDSISRVIVALPFTSLIEQTADVYRNALGHDFSRTVLEHHSNMVFGAEQEDEFDARQLASENWDAGLIVTSNVQLFESLFASKPSRARKLHRLAGSVIILDEAQSLPEELLLPSLAALRCLCADYGVTVLFCTATQPALQPAWLDGCQPVEIIDNPSTLYAELKRVGVSYIGKKSNQELADIICNHRQVLTIVNTRKQAQDVYRLIAERAGEQHVYHLSALMCAEHRRQVLDEIKGRSKISLCYVIATTLVEAGVDLDFPVVLREMTGIEGIAQAAGRCNREGELDQGSLLLFDSADYPSRHRWFSGRADLARLVLRQHPDPLTPEAVHKYFQYFYRLGTHNKLDKHNILRNLNGAADEYSFQFREIAEQFRFIPQETVPVVIPYDSACRKRLQQAAASSYPAAHSRKLQRYTVALYPLELEQLRRTGRLGNIGNMIYFLQGTGGGIPENIGDGYDNKMGLRLQPEEE